MQVSDVWTRTAAISWFQLCRLLAASTNSKYYLNEGGDVMLLFSFASGIPLIALLMEHRATRTMFFQALNRIITEATTICRLVKATSAMRGKAAFEKLFITAYRKSSQHFIACLSMRLDNGITDNKEKHDTAR